MKLTIGIATYNRNTMLKNLLMSILGVCRKHQIEVLVANDGGDGGPIIKNFCGMLTKAGMDIKFFDFKENRNIFCVRYDLLSNASNELFLFLDDDDFIDSITLHNWLIQNENKSIEEISAIDAFIFNLEEFHHRENSPAIEYHNRQEYYRTKTKLPFSLNSVIYNLSKLKKNLPLLKENINLIENHKQNIGEDVFCSYWLLGGNKKYNVKVYTDSITLLNYNHTNEHMAFINRDKNYVPKVNSMRQYTSNPNDTK